MVICYPGSKRLLAARIADIICPQLICEAKKRAMTFCEPFAGTGHVSIEIMKRLLREGVTNVTFVINDTDPYMIALWKTLTGAQKQYDDFKVFVKKSKPSLSQYNKFRKSYGSEENMSRTTLAFACIVLRSLSYASCYGTPPVKLNRLKSYESYIDKCNKVRAIASHFVIHVQNEDGIHCIKRNNKSHTFFYIDPPYAGHDGQHSLYYTKFPLGNHRKLRSLLQDVRHYYLSHTMNEEFKSIYMSLADTKIITFPARYTMGKERQTLRDALLFHE